MKMRLLLEEMFYLIFNTWWKFYYHKNIETFQCKFHKKKLLDVDNNSITGALVLNHEIIIATKLPSELLTKTINEQLNEKNSEAVTNNQALLPYWILRIFQCFCDIVQPKLISVLCKCLSFLSQVFPNFTKFLET